MSKNRKRKLKIKLLKIRWQKKVMYLEKRFVNINKHHRLLPCRVTKNNVKNKTTSNLLWQKCRKTYNKAFVNNRYLWRTAAAVSFAVCMCCTMDDSVLAMPQDGAIVGGEGKIVRNGAQMDINQQTNRMAIDWQAFNIAANETVRFNQPGADAVALNRVVGSDPSAIYGALQANGKVYLVNPNGIMFAPGARVDVGSLVASTLDINTKEFMNGNEKFFRALNSTGTVENAGEIHIAKNGTAALLGAAVTNNGIIIAEQGSIALAGGEKVTLGNGIVNIAVEPAAVATMVSNNGIIKAEGGMVLLTAQAANEIAASVINNGTIEAAGIVKENGKIRLASSDEIKNTGIINVSGETAGEIELTGKDIAIEAGSNINADATNGGGTILIGGDYQGSGDFLKAENLQVAQGSNISANAIENGNGGKVILWSDNTTTFAGNITAKGGALAGDGGFAEVSGHNKLSYKGYADLRAENGKIGSLLLDPFDFIIAASDGDITGAALGTQLNSADVTILSSGGATEGNGDIIVNDNINWTAATKLTLKAVRSIFINAGKTISATNAGANIDLIADCYIDASTTISTKGTVSQLGTITLDSSSGDSGYVRIYYNPATFGTPETFSGITTYNGHTIAYMLINALGTSGDSATTPTLGALSKRTSLWNKNIALRQDIDASDTEDWNTRTGISCIGTSSTKFTGKFDGLGHTISKLYFIKKTAVPSSGGNIGFFGYTNDAEIRNLALTDIVLTGTTCNGGLVGWNLNSSISNCYVMGELTNGTGGQVGGLVGYNDGGTISNSYFTGNVTGRTAIGGLVGYNADGTISNCYATGIVTGGQDGDTQAQYIGGLVGRNAGTSSVISDSYSTCSVTGNGSGDNYGKVGGLVGWKAEGIIKNCYSTGDVQGYDYVGGLIGYMTSAASTTDNLIENCYSIGHVQATSTNVGGLGGGFGEGATTENVVNCFWNKTISGQEDSAGGIGKTTAEMKDQTTYTDAGWDFDTIWAIDPSQNDGYPYIYKRSTPSTITLSGIFTDYKSADNSTILSLFYESDSEPDASVSTDSNGAFSFNIDPNNTGKYLISLGDTTHYGGYVLDLTGTIDIGSLPVDNKLYATGSTANMRTALGNVTLGNYTYLPYTYSGTAITVKDNVALNTIGAFAVDGNISTTSAGQTYGGALTITNSPTLSTTTSGDINFINTVGVTGNLTLSSAGAIAVNGALSGVTTLSMSAATTGTQTAAITATGIELLGAGTFTLTDTGNDTDILAGTAAGINFTDSDGFAIGTVGSTDGINNENASVILTSNGSASESA